MAHRLHFISGLPRSGSTLLAGILRQNPGCYARIQSPLAELVSSAIRTMSLHESELFIDDPQRRAVLSAILSAYYQHLPDRNLVFDTNRVWCSLLGAVAELMPQARIICCVRSPAWILDSMERQVQAHPLRASGLFGQEGGSVFNRVEAMWKAVLGASLNALKQAFYGELAHKLIVVRYESLSQKPARVLDAIYEALECQPFIHNYKDVAYDEPEFDLRLGMPGLHRVRGAVELRKREPILPPELFRQYDSEFWSGIGSNPRKVLVL